MDGQKQHKNIKVAFVHLPRTGGITFESILRNNIKDSVIRCNSARAFDQFLGAIQDQVVFANINLFYGHLPYRTLKKLPPEYKFFTFLRDPLDRLISQYTTVLNYKKTNLGTSGEMVGLAEKIVSKKWSIRDFLLKQEASYWAYPYINYLADGSNINITSKEDLGRVIDGAINNLNDFEFVGITEEYDKSLKYLEKEYGWSVKYKKLNGTPSNLRVNISNQERAELKRYLVPEYMIYNTAKEIAKTRVL